MADKTATETSNPHCADGCGARVNSPKSTFLQGHDQRLISDLSTRVTVGEMGPFQRGLLGLVENPATTAADEFYYIESGDIQDRINTISAAISHRFSTGLADKFTSAAMAKWDKSVRRSNTEAARAELRAAKAAKKASTESPATKAVFKRLQTPASSSDVSAVGTTFELDDAAAFRNEATMWLSENTDLKASTVKAADWAKIHEYFASGLVTAEAAPEPITGSPEAKKTVGQEIENLRGAKVRVKVGRWTYDAIVIGMNRAGKVSAVEYTNTKGEEKTTDKFTLLEVIEKA